MTKKSDTPAIRFKGFTDTWEQRKLCDVVKEISRNDPESEAPIMMITANNGFIEQSERYAFNNAGESLKKYILLKKGELAYNHGASKLRPYGSCFALTTAENARIPFVYHCFSAENQNAEFMSIELNGAEIENQLRKIVSSGARMDGLLNISFDEYTSVSVLLPGTEEQDCIADFFRQLDDLITLHQRKYDKLTNVKKSMLEKMFPKNGSNVPEIRFKGFTEAWEQRKLCDVVKEISRNDPESEAPIMMITANNGFIEQSERYAFNNAGESLKKYILLKKGELAYNHGASKLRPYGSCFALTTAENARIPFVYHCFSAENQNAEFMSIELNGAEIENQLRKIVSSGARMDGLLNISFDEYTSVSVLLPGTEEQDCIADFFRQLDDLITLHQRKYDKLTNVKKSMLEKMFPKNGSNVPEIRFKGFTEAWEQRKLGDVVDVRSGKDYKHLSEGNIPVYGTGGYMLSVNQALSYNEDAIGIGRKGTIDKPYILKAPFWTVDTLFYAVPSQNSDLDFVFDIFQNIDWKKKDESTGVPSLSKTAINEIDISAPCLEEQQVIGSYFSKIDNLITLHQRKRLSSIQT